MSRPNIQRGTYVTVLVGDGATPTEAFSVLCGITAKSITDQVNTQDQATRDCADPEDVPTRNIIATSRQWTISGSGVLNRDQREDIDALVGQVVNYRFMIAKKASETTGTPLNGYYGGAGMMTRKVINGDDGTVIGLDTTIESDGPWDWVDVP